MPTPTHANPNHGVPIIPTKGGYTFSRQHFLGGILKTFYGPGQPPDCGEPGNYSPPTEWPAANTLLRRPQVAWLYVGMPFQFTGKYFKANYFSMRVAGVPLYHFSSSPGSPIGLYVYAGWYYITGKAVIVAQWNVIDPTVTIVPPPDSFLGPWVQLDAKNWAVSSPSGASNFGNGGEIYSEVVDNPYPDEHDRIAAIYEEAKAAIETLRPGRTYVSVIDPWVFDPSIDSVGTTDFRFAMDDVYFVDLGKPGEYWPMISPADTASDTSKPYFGTNFLNVFCGCPASTWLLVSDTTLLYPLDQKWEPARDASLALLAINNLKFAGYASRMFGVDVPFPNFPSLPSITAGSLTQPAGIVYPASFGNPDWRVYAAGTKPGGAYGTEWTPGWSTGTEQAFIDSCVATINSAVAARNSILENLHVFGDAQLSADEADMLALGVDAEYVADSSSIVDAASLVELIAAHYGFDPDTGQDL